MFLHHVRTRRAEVEPVTLPMKAHAFLVAPRIPKNVPLLMDINQKLTKLGFKDYETHLQLGFRTKELHGHDSDQADWARDLQADEVG